MSDSARFPEGFLWGAATSAYQIEGSPLADGAGPNIWHRFTRVKGAIRDGDTGDVACDHYRRWADDVALMRTLGLGAYRFSIAWARVFPEGRGAVNTKGLDFYARLIDALLEAGIVPAPTLYHWDLPAALDDRGGWTNPDSPSWFQDYARLVFERLGDRVPMFATFNEPILISDAGYVLGIHAPGHRSVAEAAAVARHLMLAHGAAVEAFRGTSRGRIGIVLNLEPRVPASSSREDAEATRKADVYYNQQYLHAVFTGRWPEGLADILGDAFRELTPSESARVSQPIDWLGVNYYSRRLTSAARRPPIDALDAPPQLAATDLGWEIYPQGLADTLVMVTERYGKVPLYVTENGAAYDDADPGPAGEVDDPGRVSYLREHVRAARAAINRGADLRGYFAWSLMDNFEWQQGYSKRFGIVRVDYTTQTRTLKRSARVYRDIMFSNGVVRG
jgi:beta-glucosidase